jgi:hypothetical protein
MPRGQKEPFQPEAMNDDVPRRIGVRSTAKYSEGNLCIPSVAPVGLC